MNQHELEREVARATGESVAAIATMGFSLVDMSPAVADRRRQVRRDTARRSFKTVVNKTFKRVGKKTKTAVKASAGVSVTETAKCGKVLRPCIRVVEPVPAQSPNVLPLSLVLDFDHPWGA